MLAKPEMVHRAIRAAQRTLLEEKGYGAAIALVANGNLLFSEGVGWLDWQRSIPFPAGGSSYIWSITKSLYAVVVLQAVERCLINLDEPIKEYLPEWQNEATVSVRHLLNHTSGLPDYSYRADYHAALRRSPSRPWSSEEFLARTLLPGALLFAPGTGWSYSNIGYLLIRQVMEGVVGQSMSNILQDSIFSPLGLKRFKLADSPLEDLFPGWSTVFDPAGAPSDVSRLYHPGWVSHGTAAGTAAELASIFEGMFNGVLLGQASLQAMMEAVEVPGEHWLFKDHGYGLGLMIDGHSGFGTLVGHGGEGPGYSTAVLRFTNVDGQAITAVALANSDQPDLGLKIAGGMAVAVADGS